MKVTTYGLDPAWSLPEMSWSVMLEMVGASLELLTGYDMIIVVER